MVDLSTTYAGMELENPVIVGSSGLTDTIDKIRRMADQGPGAIVLKSLFEEQILHEAGRMIDDYAYPEAADYIREYSKSKTVGDYLDLIGEARKRIPQPVIASINCISGTDWTDFARQIGEAGANALELNMFILPVDGEAPERLEEQYFDILEKVKRVTSIPLVAKISPYFSNLLYVVERLYAMGVRGVVLFNRMFEPDIDIEKMRMTAGEVFSRPSDIRQSLRWISLVADKQRKIDLSASTGIHDGAAAVKMLLAGATTVQICSALYRKGPEHVATVIGEVKDWMERKGYHSPDDFRGIMSYRNIEDPRVWERVQFMRYYSSHD
jgi:dihydroorotate dehydrogenase (fumarate)